MIPAPALAVYAVVPACDLCGVVALPGVDCCDPDPAPTPLARLVARIPRPYPADVVPLVTAGLVALLAAGSVLLAGIGTFDPAPPQPAPSAGSTWNPDPATVGVWQEPRPATAGLCDTDASCAAWARTHT